MKRKILIACLALFTCVGTVFATRVQIGELYYDIKPGSQTADVTYKSLDNSGWNEGWDISTVTIPSSVNYMGEEYTVRKIADYAFYGCSNLTSITIANSVTVIGEYAFSGCSGLTFINIPNSVTHIFERAFFGCTKLSSITFPATITRIGNNAFTRCTGLTSIIIPETITSLGSNAFSECTGLTSVTWNVKNHAGYYNAVSPFPKNVSSFVFGENVEAIPAYLCRGLKIQSIIIPDRVKRINSSAFSDCAELKSIIISDSVKVIEVMAFQNCAKLESVYIGSAVDSIRNSAFEECNNLKAVYISDLEAWCKIDFSTISDTWYPNRNNPLEYAHNLYLNGELLTEVIIPETITEIKNWAFCNAECIKSVKILGDVTRIGNGAFYGCRFMTHINIPYTTRSIGESAFCYCSSIKTPLIIPEGIETIEKYTFSYCLVSLDIIIPNSVTTIKDHAFYMVGGHSDWSHKIIIPNSVTQIGEQVFSAGVLDDIYLGKNVENIGKRAFNSSFGQRRIYAQMETPPIITSDVFGQFSTQWANNDCYVPYNSLSLYQNADVWQEFNLIADQERFIATGLPNNPLYGWVDGHDIYKNGDTATLSVHAYDGYEFVRWSDGNTDNPRNVVISSDTTLIAEYAVNKHYISVSCDEQQGSIEGSSGYYDYGSGLSFTAIPNEGYYFVQWSDSVTDNPRTITLTQDTTITALFAPQIFTIKFVDENDTILAEQEYEYGVTPVLPADPQKTGDAQYSYTFAGWSPHVVTVTKDATYKATYNATLNKYTITFISEDSVLSANLWEYGSMPIYPKGVPTKEEDDKYTYTFDKWAPEIVPVVEDATYTAIYTATEKTNGIEDIYGDSAERPVKYIENGDIYILMPNGKKYSIIGELIK